MIENTPKIVLNYIVILCFSNFLGVARYVHNHVNIINQSIYLSIYLSVYLSILSFMILSYLILSYLLFLSYLSNLILSI